MCGATSRGTTDQRDHERAAWLQQLMDHVEGQIALGDTRASLLLAADSILLAGLGLAATGDEPMLDQASASTTVLVGLCALALVVGLVAALLAALPNPRVLWPGATAITNCFVFASIARTELDDYVETTRGMTAAQRVEALSHAVHGKSCWLLRKFTRLFVAVSATVTGVLAAAAALATELLLAG